MNASIAHGSRLSTAIARDPDVDHLRGRTRTPNAMATTFNSRDFECLADTPSLRQARLIIGGVWNVPASTSGFKGGLDLLAGCFGHRRLFGSLGQLHQSNALIAKTHGPVERHAPAGEFLEGFAIGGDRLLQPRRSALALAEGLECIAEIVLGRGPLQRYALAGVFLEGVAIGGDRLL